MRLSSPRLPQFPRQPRPQPICHLQTKLQRTNLGKLSPPLTLRQKNSHGVECPEISPRVTGSVEFVNGRSEEHTSELPSLMRISYAVFCLKKNNYNVTEQHYTIHN